MKKPTIKYSEVFSILASTLPEFPATAEDWEDRLSYPFLSDLVRFVCDQAFVGSKSEPELLAALLDRLLADGDSDVHDLVLDGLETISECPCHDAISQHFSPPLAKAWQERLAYLGRSRREHTGG